MSQRLLPLVAVVLVHLGNEAPDANPPRCRVSVGPRLSLGRQRAVGSELFPVRTDQLADRQQFVVCHVNPWIIHGGCRPGRYDVPARKSMGTSNDAGLSNTANHRAGHEAAISRISNRHWRPMASSAPSRFCNAMVAFHALRHFDDTPPRTISAQHPKAQAPLAERVVRQMRLRSSRHARPVPGMRCGCGNQTDLNLDLPSKQSISTRRAWGFSDNPDPSAASN